MITRTAWRTFNIGKFSPSELAQLALQLEACEGAGHLPEPDVPSARGGQLALHLGGEGHTVDVLRKGFGPQDNGLLPPFPDSQHVVRAAPHRCKEIAVVGLEVHVAVGLLCSLSQQAVELEVGVAVDGDAGLGSLLSHSKVLVAWVDLGRGGEGEGEGGRRRGREEGRGGEERYVRRGTRYIRVCRHAYVCYIRLFNYCTCSEHVRLCILQLTAIAPMPPPLRDLM